MNAVLERMTGQELLLMRVLKGRKVEKAINAVLDRRAATGPRGRASEETLWAGRTFAMRNTTRLAA